MAWHQGQAYGQDLRDRVLHAPGSLAAVSARFGVSKSSVARVHSRHRRLGEDPRGLTATVYRRSSAAWMRHWWPA